MTSTSAKGQAKGAQPRKEDAFSRCIDKWLTGTIRSWTRNAMKRHLDVAFNSGAGAPQVWPWAQCRTATIMVDALAPQLRYRSNDSSDNIDFASGPDAEANNEWYRELVRGWLQSTSGTELPSDEWLNKRPGESSREYLRRLSRSREAQTAGEPSTREVATPNIEWSEDEAMCTWTVLASRFARAVDDGICDAQGRLSELSRGRNKRPMVNLDACGRELHEQLLKNLRTSTNLNSAESYREIQREAHPGALTAKMEPTRDELRFVRRGDQTVAVKGYSHETLRLTYKRFTPQMEQIGTVVKSAKGKITVTELKKRFSKTALGKAADPVDLQIWIDDFKKCSPKDRPAGVGNHVLSFLSRKTGLTIQTMKTYVKKPRE